nr:ankyrin repeat domain-containing protein [uncultured Flavobacterium sp.]
MKKTIIYLGITLMSFFSLSFASNTNGIGNQKKLNVFSESPSTLAIAISKGEIETVKQFIENGTKVNKKLNGLTPLMYAARYNKVEIIEYLLQKGADRTIKDSQGFTALKYAELSNAYEAVAILKSSAGNEQAKVLLMDDATLLNPDTVLVFKSNKTMDEIIAEDEKIIESTDSDEIQPLNFTEINKKSVVKNESNSQGVVAI